MPLLAIRTETDDKDEIDNMEAFAANFGSNGYIILNKEDFSNSHCWHFS